MGLPATIADAAASVVPPSRMLRRLTARWPAFGVTLLSLPDISGSLPYHTSESEVARGRIHRFRVARSRAIAAAVVRRAQVRASFDDLAGNPDLRLAGVVAPLLRPAARIFWNAARTRI